MGSAVATEHGLRENARVLALFAFSTETDEPFDAARARHVLERPLDVDACRGLSQTPFLNAVFVNRRYADSSGDERETRWVNDETRAAVVFTPSDLDELAQRYLLWREQMNGFSFAAGEPEQQLWAFLSTARDERLQVLSCSRFFAFESE